jgi:hypothetical protein
MAAELVLPENPAQQLQEQHLIQRFRDGEHELFYELVQPYEWRGECCGVCNFAQ